VRISDEIISKAAASGKYRKDYDVGAQFIAFLLWANQCVTNQHQVSQRA